MSEQLSILGSCRFIPIIRNSVLELRERRFVDIQEEICCRAVWRQQYWNNSYEDGIRKKQRIICIKVVV